LPSPAALDPEKAEAVRREWLAARIADKQALGLAEVDQQVIELRLALCRAPCEQRCPRTGFCRLTSGCSAAEQYVASMVRLEPPRDARCPWQRF
jgi:hypothetical protein